ncbi:sensor histidine kinase [Ornithinimicrobium cryptoxanthini]|uniref:histidine kinase n=1 Tax=Ornithinimicrobium cryptoxanthini TaxID=2934161 RepID=A0ABY4YI65_9MICO|nr:HAMP domain-containing sensor histidine kinase [Ornithinimicrobium cryptoxanthini]USQ76449.1 HAMP domain-containing histidine kinase [Ornithinimicrobium cryptoxanthini]
MRTWFSRVLGNMRLRILATTAVLLACFFALSLLQQRGTLLERLDDDISTQLAGETEELLLLSDGRHPQSGLPLFEDVASLFEFYFRGEVPDEGQTLMGFVDGRLVHEELHVDAVSATELPEMTAFWLSQEVPVHGGRVTPHGEARYAVHPISVGGQEGHFVVASFPRAEQAAIDAAIGRDALFQLSIIALASALGYGLAGRVLRPLRSLAEMARTISETDLTRRIPVRGQDEASQIAGAFNDMLGRIERAFSAQREFLDDVSHELRAPLTVIRGHLELLDLEDDPLERAATTVLLTDEIDRMNRMVEDLLTLARAQHPDFLKVGDVDVAVWTEEVFRKASVLCAREWELVPGAEVVIQADAQRLTQAVMQFAVNACQHSGADARVRLGSVVDGQDLVMWLEDDGRGVAADDAERVFERFQRGATERRSSGLGLSIVAVIARSHGGTARVVPAHPRGARFEIVLPLTAPDGSTVPVEEARPESRVPAA